MIADGVIRCVQISRNDPVDRLVIRYNMALMGADILSIILGTVPSGKDALNMTTDIIKQKYPYYDNQELILEDKLEKYNRSMTFAKKLSITPKGDRNGR